MLTIGQKSNSGSVLMLIAPRDTPEIVEEAFALARLGMYLTNLGETVEYSLFKTNVSESSIPCAMISVSG